MLFGPDGKPLQKGRIVGGPKSLADLPVMTDDVIDAMVLQAEGLIDQGTPMEVPVAMPQAILFGMLRTLQVLRENGNTDRVRLLKAFGTLRFLLQESTSAPEEHWVELCELAHDLRTQLGAEPLPGEVV